MKSGRFIRTIRGGIGERGRGGGRGGPRAGPRLKRAKVGRCDKSAAALIYRDGTAVDALEASNYVYADIINHHRAAAASLT